MRRRIRKTIPSLIEIDRVLNERLTRQYFIATVFLIGISVLLWVGISKQSLIGSLLALFSIAVFIEVIKEVVRLLQLRSDLVKNPDKYKKDNSENVLENDEGWGTFFRF